MVEAMLVRLASGEWERFSLCRVVGGKDSILYLALYGEGEKEGILWQLDVEFDEVQEVLMQVVKVWRVGVIQVVS